MPDALIERIDRAGASLEALRARVLDGAPWPLSERFGTEPEASWGPPEVLAHVSEMLAFWRGELERILDARVDPVPFGRVATDPLRIGLIARDRTLPPGLLFDRIAAGVEAWRHRLAALREEDAVRRGAHPTLGELTAASMIERFVVGHLEEHVAQLERVLADRAG